MDHVLYIIRYTMNNVATMYEHGGHQDCTYNIFGERKSVGGSVMVSFVFQFGKF